MSDLINLTDPYDRIEDDTPIERAIEAENCDFYNMEQKMEPVAMSQTPVPATVPVSTLASPGIRIMTFISVILAICFVIRKDENI